MEVFIKDKIITKEIEDMDIKEISYDIFFKAIFSREKECLFKILKIILDIKERFDNPVMMIGYEIPGINKNSKVNKTDMLIELSDNSYIHIEVNRRKENNILARNIIQVWRIYGMLRKSGDDDRELDTLKVKQLNINAFPTFTGKPIEYIVISEKESGIIVSEILNFCNIDIDKCYEMIYNKNIKDIPKSVRYGAIFKAKSIKEMSYILGEDILTMKEKKSLLKTVKEVNSDNKILQEWMVEDNARMKYENQMSTAWLDGRREGIIDTIKNMLNKSTDYNYISDVTGRTINEIKVIEKSMKNM